MPSCWVRNRRSAHRNVAFSVIEMTSHCGRNCTQRIAGLQRFASRRRIHFAVPDGEDEEHSTAARKAERQANLAMQIAIGTTARYRRKPGQFGERWRVAVKTAPARRPFQSRAHCTNTRRNTTKMAWNYKTAHAAYASRGATTNAISWEKSGALTGRTQSAGIGWSPGTSGRD